MDSTTAKGPLHRNDDSHLPMNTVDRDRSGTPFTVKLGIFKDALLSVSLSTLICFILTTEQI